MAPFDENEEPIAVPVEPQPVPTPTPTDPGQPEVPTKPGK